MKDQNQSQIAQLIYSLKLVIYCALTPVISKIGATQSIAAFVLDKLGSVSDHKPTHELRLIHWQNVGCSRKKGAEKFTNQEGIC